MILQIVIALTGLVFAQEDPGLARLEREMQRISQVSGGMLGATAIHIETGRRVSINVTERFPMASTVKVPLAVQLLSLVDEGKEQLDRLIMVQQRDLHPGSGTLTDLFNKGGLALSIRNLMELMLLISDNSATDLLLRVAGGPEAVTSRMRSLGIRDLRVDRSTALLIADAGGYRDKLPAETEWSPQVFQQASRATSRELRAKARELFNDDPRDTSTPGAMADLLVRIQRKELLQPQSAELLLDIMRRCRTGQTRLQGILPAGTVVAHKTGSITNSANDVGIMTLPDNAGHVALAAFVKKSDREAAQMDRGIAEVARAVHDYFLFQPKGPVDYDRLAARILESLRPEAGEKYRLRFDPGYFEGLTDALRSKLKAAAIAEASGLNDASIYLWLPLRPGGPGLPAQERQALKEWVDKGGARRQVHFHWGEGSVSPDGLYGEHSTSLDALYQEALQIDRDALSKLQDRVIKQLAGGLIRVKTGDGTDMQFRTGARPFSKQDGDASAARARLSKMRIDRDIELPAGVIRAAPLEETASGVMVIPEARFGAQVARSIRFTFQKGRIVKVEAGENLAAVEAMLKEGGVAANSFREFALGLNHRLTPEPGARVLPYYGYGKGVVRLSLGDNEELGGNVRGGFVRWFFFPAAQVTVDGKPLDL
ncbi:MAG: class A beta-lactamase [Candidatus Solibacter usitatus]|nr:class A beta-lactamase [Candidatus Solibacter usitatus]